MKELRVPKLSLGDGDQMVVLDWLVESGAEFAEGDILLEVETDKATMEIDAPFSGVLARALCGAGQAVAPGDLIAWIAEPGESYDPAALDGEPGAAQDGPPEADGAAEAHGVPVLDARDGRAVELTPRHERVAEPVDHGELRGIPERVASAPPAPEPEALDADPELTGAFETVPLTRHRGAIARSMTASSAIPQFAVHRDLEADPLAEALAALRSDVATATMSDVVLLCVARALGMVPAINAWCDGSRVHRFEDANIALAVDGPDGVIAPVIRGTQELGLAELAAERMRVVELARQGRVSGADLAGATFSVSNIGPLGAHGLLPMLTPPQVGILALGAGRASDGGRKLITATFVGDHRAIDGADGARFLAATAEAIAALPDRA